MSQWCTTCHRRPYRSCDSSCQAFGKDHDELAAMVLKSEFVALSGQEFDVSGSLLAEHYTHDERVEFLKRVDRFLRQHISCEENIMPYLMCGIPDGSTNEDYEDYAEDWVLIVDALYEFAKCIMNDVEDNK